MELTDELLQRILGAGQLRFGDRSGERRQTPRLPLGSPVLIQSFVPGTPPLNARARDISKTGIGILCTKPVQPETSILTRLPQQQGKFVWMHCKVARCEDVGDGLFIIGATFEQIAEPNATAGSSRAGAPPPQVTTGASAGEKQGQASAECERGESETLEEYIRRRRAQRKEKK